MTRVKQTLRDLNVTPRKERGQNFVIDPSVIQEITAFAAPQTDELIVEIGPGLGALTEKLCGIVSAPVTVIEIEPVFCDELSARFPGIKVICDDVRRVDITSLGESLTVFGNLPYSYSTDIVFHLVSYASHLRRAVLLLQREFVERMAANPGSRIYGALSIGCQLWADIREGPIVSGTSFHPPAHVDSRLVELRFLHEPRYHVEDLRWFRTVVRASFSGRRKMLSNSIRGLLRTDAAEARSILESAGIDPARRAETLSVEEFAGLSNALKSRTMQE